MGRALQIVFAVPGLPIALPDPFGVGLGGSETAALQLAQALARRGHKVTAYARVDQPATWAGVALEPLAAFLDDRRQRRGDVLIAERDPGLMGLVGDFAVTLLHIHEMPDQAKLQALRAVFPLCDRVLAVSSLQADRWRSAALDLPHDLIAVVGNGVDHGMIAAAAPLTRRPDPAGLLYAARPERGLDVVLMDLMPRLLRLQPGLTLHVAGYDMPHAGIDAVVADLRRQSDEVYRHQVRWHGSLPKAALYRLMRSVAAMVYPCPGRLAPAMAETSWILGMEALAAGLPIIATDHGALRETIGEAGILVPLNGAAHAGEGDVPDRMAEAVGEVLRKGPMQESMRQAGRERAQAFTWSVVADRVLAQVDQAKVRRGRPARPARSAREIASSVLALTPTYDGKVTRGFCRSLALTTELLGGQGIKFRWETIAGSSLVGFARNELAAMVLEAEGVSHALWLDADIEWRAQDVVQLIEHDVDVVAGMYRMKDPDERGYFCRPLEGPQEDVPRGLVEVSALGFGFVMMKRTVLERMVEAYGNRQYRNHLKPREGAMTHDLFPTGLTEDNDPLGEDYGFWRLWRAIGGRVLVDYTVLLDHMGVAHYQGRPASIVKKLTEPASTQAAA